MQDKLFFIGSHPVTDLEVAWALGGLALVLAGIVMLMLIGRRRDRLAADMMAAEAARDTDEQIAAMLRLQSEMAGRMQAMAEGLGARQTDMTRIVSERLDGLTHRLGATMVANTRATNENLTRLNERIAVIDRAQKALGDLSGEVMQLRSVLSDKQTRGAYGQGRMEAIIADALPPDAFTFQATLPGGMRPDCLVHMPGGAPPLVIDAKFPLEGWNAFKTASEPEGRTRAQASFRRDVLQHIRDISQKYLVAGETQDTAFLFVPSESIFADLHEHFGEVIERAHRSRVVIVSPSLLLLSVQVVQAILRDHRMREQAHLVQSEVGLLMDDVERLHDRVLKLQAHFGQASRDIEQIVVSSEKVQKRGMRIEDFDLAADQADDATPVLRLDRMAGE